MSALKEIVLGLTVATMGVGQTLAHPEFEVASIRVSANAESIEQGNVAIGLHMDGSQVRVASFTVKDYLALAFRMKVAQISGPDWVSSERFDISATIPADGKTSNIPEMFQVLLAQRFQLNFTAKRGTFRCMRS